jgi:hypothetical protein
MKPFRISQKAGGQSLMEYVGIPCLVIVVSLGAFTALQGNLSQLALDSKQSIQNDINLRNDTKNRLATVSSEEEEPDVMVSRNEILEFLPEETLPVLDFPTGSLSETINTLGANGTISLMAQRIEAIANSLLISNKISKPQYRVLMRLANRGYVIAEIDYQVEQAAKESQSVTEFKNKQIVINGRSYPIGQFAAFSDLNNTHSSMLLTEGNGSGNNLRSFITVYNTFVNNGGVGDSAVDTLIKSLFNNTIAVQLAADASRKNILDNNSSLDQLIQDTASQISNNATTICLSGDNTSDGKKCSD